MPKEFPKNNLNRKVIYLILWIIFFIGISIFIMSARKGNHPVNNNVIENKTYNEDDFEILDYKNIYKTAKENILKRNYNFNYTYDGPGSQVTYTGTSLGNKISLIRKDVNGEEKIYIENDLLYKYNQEEKYITDYEINHETYLDIDYIFESIDEKSLKYVENNGVLEIDFQVNDIYGKMYISNKNISIINIYEDITTYTLEYTNIGSITEVN